MVRKAANPTLVMLVQQIKPECWQHSADPAFVGLLEQAHAANCRPKDDPQRIDALRKAAHEISEYLVKLLEADGRVVEDAQGILHGDDTQQCWDDAAAVLGRCGGSVGTMRRRRRSSCRSSSICTCC
ncbi:hypothetical protein [Corynebacterium variabile]|uniref:hypothetical protein n=1 Tax=Corynebacterium variabile TaxID=1727 RepID=UPI0028D3EBDB|nr:hypothetical protein [Corynebacterium variabile]